jgi:metal-responsive CopG/Arc/MetJ family transcriptional regulator
MGRKRKDNIQFTVTLPRLCVEWLDKNVESRKYATRNHGIEVCILEKIKRGVDEK